ncbi:hypothetical protein Tco_0515282 [Tanacetum coccineum]
MEALQATFTEFARNVERYFSQHNCSWCRGTFNGGNCPGCSSVKSGNEFVYDPNPCSYNETHNFFNQPPQHQYETYSCELCGDSHHYGFDCQTWTPLVYEQDLCSSQNFSNDQSPYYSMSLLQKFHCCEYCEGIHDSSNCQSRNLVFYESNSYNNFDSSGFDQPPRYPIVHPPLHEMSLHELSMMMNLGTPTPEPLVNSFVYEESDDDIEVTPTYTPPLPFLTTMEPADTLLMGDEDSSTTLARETDEFIKSSANDLVPIPRESEVTLGNNLECNMRVNTPFPTTDVKEENFDINSPLGEHVVDFLMENEDIADLPRHLVKQLLSHLVKNPSSTKRMSDEPLGDDSKPRSYDVTFSNSLFDYNDDYTLCYDNPLFYDEFEDISSLDPPKSTLIIDESTLLVTPPLASKQFSLREVERFDPFFLPNTVG